MTVGLFTMLKDEGKGLKLLEKACEMGYFGSQACFRLGKILERKEETVVAKAACRKACEGGHAVGGMALNLMSYEK